MWTQTLRLYWQGGFGAFLVIAGGLLLILPWASRNEPRPVLTFAFLCGLMMAVAGVMLLLNAGMRPAGF